MTKIRVLCVINYFLPGYKAGGPIRTIANMSDILAGEVEFAIITRDRDLGDDSPFESIQVDEWHAVGSSSVYYASPVAFGVPAVERAFDDHDVLYLNSFFSVQGSIRPYLKFRNRAKILIAPRGEFSEGALALKSMKKRVFLRLAKMLGLYRDVQWHASTTMEAQDIERVFPNTGKRIYLAMDPVVLGPSARPAIAKESIGALKVAFISRISPMKNLLGLLRIITTVRREIVLSIYGPAEDKEYWKRCQSVISKAPNNVRVVYYGPLKANEVSVAFSEHDLFAFPTHGENFGHVIFESLRVGTPVLLSDQTPWKSHPSGAITVVPLNAPEEWRSQLELAADRTDREREEIRTSTLQYARNFVRNGETRLANLRMFVEVAKSRKKFRPRAY